MKRLVLLSCLLFLVCPALAARLEMSTGDPMEVRIAVGAPTVVTFPEKITAIPTSADPLALSLEIEGGRLFVQSLREDFGAVLFVVGESGRLYLLNLVEHDIPDVEVQVVLPRAPPRFGEAARRLLRRASRPCTPPAPQSRCGGLMATMMKGETLPGVEVLAHDQELGLPRTTWRYARRTCTPPAATWASSGWHAT